MAKFDTSNSLGKTIKKSLYFLFSKKNIQILWLVLIIIATSLAPSIDSILLQNLTDQIEFYSENIPSNLDLTTILFKWVIVYALWWESLNLAFRLYDYLYLKIISKIKVNVIEEFYDYTQYHEHQFFQTTLAGDIASRITEASRSLEMIFAHANEKILRQLFILLFAFITLCTVHLKIATIFLVWLISFISTSLYFSKTINNYSTIYAKNKARVSGKIVDAISNISAIRMFAAYESETKYLKKYTQRSLESDQAMQWFMLKLRYALSLLCTLMISVMIYYIIILRSNLEISIGQCVLILTLCIAVIDNIWDLTQSFGDLFEQIGSFNQSITLLSKYKINDKANAKKLDVNNPSIEFKNVTFDYKNNNNRFENQSISIKAYEKVALIGFSGSGKTTFTNLISRLYNIQKGVIEIDGQDITKISQNSLRRNISLIPQEPILFHRSIMDNIRYGSFDATDKEVYEAAKMAHIHDFIQKLPDGYNTICGERGNNFSGGQRQRIVIARAFLENAPILILDEATSALDNHTEKLIQDSLQKLMERKTVLIIAHRISTLKHTDRALVFEKGSIVEEGTHAELKKTGKLYKTLWNNGLI